MESWTQRILLNLTRAGVALVLPLAALASESDRPLIEPAVQPKRVNEALIDTENFEIGAFTGVINIEDFGSSFVWGGKLTYHLSESLFLEANIGFAEGGKTSFEQLAGNVQLLSDDDRKYQYYNVNLGYNILPGEAFFSSGYAFNTNFYLIGGVGSTDFAGDNRFTANVGVGYQILLTDGLAISFSVREHAYDIDILGEKKTAFNTEFSGGLAVFF